MKQPFRKDLSYEMFGQLLALSYAGKADDGASLWYCKCMRCGGYKTVRAQTLQSGGSKTCGCSSITHGLTRGGKPPEYKSWLQIKDRCLNPKSHAYQDYGGRGITICQGWNSSFSDFLTVLGPRPKGTSIERCDNNKGYTCGKCDECLRNGWTMNCRWATRKEQANNRRSTTFITYQGETKSVTQWAEIYGLRVATLWARIYIWKWALDRAFKRRA